MAERVLIVDDDKNLLKVLKKKLGKEFEIYAADCAEQGLRLLKTRGPFAVALTDMWMSGMNGIEFLKIAKEESRDTVRILFTAKDDQQTAVDAVNEGYVFRFLCKPCSFAMIERSIMAAAEQHRLVIAERDFLSKTLTGTLRTLTDVLSLVCPEAFSKTSRVRRLAVQSARLLQVRRPWELELAAVMTQIGWITDLVELEITREDPTDDFAIKTNSKKTDELGWIGDIPRLEGIQELLRLANEPGELRKYQNPCDQICINAQLLSLILDFDDLCASGLKARDAIEQLRRDNVEAAHVLLDVIAEVLDQDENMQVISTAAHTLPRNAVLAEDLYTLDGRMLLKKGQEIGNALKLRILKISNSVGLKPIKILHYANSTAEFPNVLAGSNDQQATTHEQLAESE